MAAAVLSLSEVLRDGSEEAVPGVSGWQRRLSGPLGQWNEARKDLKRRLAVEAEVPAPSLKFVRDRGGSLPLLGEVLGVRTRLTSDAREATASPHLDLSTLHAVQTDLLQLNEVALETLLQLEDSALSSSPPLEAVRYQGSISQLAVAISRLMLHLSSLSPVVIATSDTSYASAMQALVDEVWWRHTSCFDIKVLRFIAGWGRDRYRHQCKHRLTGRCQSSRPSSAATTS